MSNFKIQRKLSFTYEDKVIKARHINGLELLEVESALRDVQSSPDEEGKGKEFYLFSLDFLSKILTDFPLEIDDEVIDWTSLDEYGRKSLLCELPINHVIGLWQAYNLAISPSQEDKKKSESTSSLPVTKTAASTKEKIIEKE